MESTTAPSACPPHTGLLRDETLVLRWLFGYHTATQTLQGQFLSARRRLQKTKMVDVIFLSIDIDSLQEQEQIIQQFHVGISILDTRSLQAFVTGSRGSKQEAHIIKSHHFVVGSSKFQRKKPNKFLFGKFETITLPNLKGYLSTLTSHRDIILVFHGGGREQWVLNKLDIDLRPLYIIDTVKAAQHPLQLSYRYSLEKLLDELGIPFIDLHIAGNDAHFVLRSLLMIAVRDAERQTEAFTPLGWWLPIFRAIAQAPRPLTKAEMEASARRREVES